MSVIEVCGLTKCFGAVLAVDDVSFCAGAGTVTGFPGPNGAGKTTMLRMLLGLIAPAGGTATICSRSASPAGYRRAVGAAFQASKRGRQHSHRSPPACRARAAGAGQQGVGLQDARPDLTAR